MGGGEEGTNMRRGGNTDRDRGGWGEGGGREVERMGGKITK